MAGEPATLNTPDSLALGIIVFVDLVFVLALVLISLALGRDSKWSLAAALAENIEWSQPAAALGAQGLLKPAAPAADAQSRIEPSASRLIAFVGMLAVVVVFVGMADCVLWRCFTGHPGGMEMGDMIKFLFGGASLFVPYAVNQLRSAFESFGAPKKP
jgi:hypothetical protein